MIRLKCDRKFPCETCRRRGLAESCTYVTSSKLTNPSRAQSRTPNTSVEVREHGSRSREVEASVTSNNTTNFQTSGDREVEQLDLPQRHDHGADLPSAHQPGSSARVGRMNLSSTETTYIDSSHWTVILDGVGLILNANLLNKWLQIAD